MNGSFPFWNLKNRNRVRVTYFWVHLWHQASSESEVDIFAESINGELKAESSAESNAESNPDAQTSWKPFKKELSQF